MSQALQLKSNTDVPAAPSYLTGNNALSSASAGITNFETKPIVKMDKGLWLTRAGEKVKRMSMITVEPDGTPVRSQDIADFVVLGYSDVTYAYYKPGQGMGGGRPICYSVGGHAPHVTAPEKQSHACKSCPQNQTGTGQGGHGKACSKRRMLIGFMADDASHEVVAIQVPTLSNWFNPDNAPGWFGFNDYVKQLNQYETPIYHVLTRVQVGEAANAVRLNFAFAGYISEEMAKVISAPETIAKVTEFREYFEYAQVATTPAATTPAIAAPATGAAADPAVVSLLMDMLSNPATADAANKALTAMGVTSHLSGPVDKLADLRSLYPGVPDVALEAIYAAQNTLPHMQAPAPAPAPVQAPAPAPAPEVKLEVPAQPPAPVLGGDVVVPVVSAAPESDEALQAMAAFLAGVSAPTV